MEAGSVVLGLVGKTNVGKSTFFTAATEQPVKIENRPFVTIEPNVGVAYARKKCAHVDLGLPKCDPVNSLCLEGWRYIPVKLLDVAGLVPGAHKGRGLGNRFLDDVRKADALLLVVDASGSTDPEGVPSKPGSHSPVEEVESMILEIREWMVESLRRDWERFARRVDTGGISDIVGALHQRVSGFEIPRSIVAEVLEATGLGEKRLTSWGDEDLRLFVSEALHRGKPMVIVANKSDVPGSEENIKALRGRFPEIPVIPTSAIAEAMLRRLARKGVIKYLPGDGSFEVLKPEALDGRAKSALKLIEERVFKLWGSTGVVQSINTAVFDRLGMIAVYPVEDPNKYTDKEGRVLPDVLLVPKGSNPRELAFRIHTDLGKTFLYAINAKTRQRVGENYSLKDGDVIKIVATTGK
ncbi:MAG: redox-regulated ATPase YchF [Aeropyrum sp.]|nr:redox-regulated ATPase YchF [Aeropyrum sp.]